MRQLSGTRNCPGSCLTGNYVISQWVWLLAFIPWPMGVKVTGCQEFAHFPTPLLSADFHGIKSYTVCLVPDKKSCKLPCIERSLISHTLVMWRSDYWCLLHHGLVCIFLGLTSLTFDGIFQPVIAAAIMMWELVAEKDPRVSMATFRGSNGPEIIMTARNIINMCDLTAPVRNYK